jgi:hypothetical protein
VLCSQKYAHILTTLYTRCRLRCATADPAGQCVVRSSHGPCAAAAAADASLCTSNVVQCCFCLSCALTRDSQCLCMCLYAQLLCVNVCVPFVCSFMPLTVPFVCAIYVHCLCVHVCAFCVLLHATHSAFCMCYLCAIFMCVCAAGSGGSCARRGRPRRVHDAGQHQRRYIVTGTIQ